MNEVSSQLTKLISNEPNIADQNPEISKPEMTPATIISKIAFNTKVKNPRVKMLIGRVRIKRMGLKKAFNIPKIAAAKKAEKKPLTWIPSIK